MLEPAQISATATVEKSIEQRVFARQIAFFAAQQFITMLGAGVVALFVYLMFWDVAERLYLNLWLFASGLVLVIRLVVLKVYYYSKTDLDSAANAVVRNWSRWFVGSLFVTGIIWAIGSIVFFDPDRPEHVFFLVCMYAGLISAASVSLPAYAPAYLAFIIPSSIPFSLRCIVEGGTVYFTIGLSVFLYLAANLLTCLSLV